MPDHLHALWTFDLRADSITHVIADWKGLCPATEDWPFVLDRTMMGPDKVS
jgi:hypothetical protein